MIDCGGCTLCCRLTNIVYMNSPQGEYCKECNPNIGCTIYEKRPEHCRIFQCCYSQMEKVHLDLRPDRCKIVFEKITDTLILGTIDGKIKDISELINRQITFFGKEGISVMLQQFNPYKFVCKMVKDANKFEIIKALEEKADDCSKLY